ncbi:MAG: DUF4258 domain-containing protein [Polyangiales bacterium]
MASPDEALEAIRNAGLRGIFLLTDHAEVRMAERGVRWADVRHALQHAPSCRQQANGRWTTDSADLDGDSLTLVVAIEADVVVVTLY